MTIDEVKRIQKDNGLLSKHIVWIGPTDFAIAHTDHERSTLHPLSLCDLHKWLENQDGPPYPIGVYVVTTDSTTRWNFDHLGR